MNRTRILLSLLLLASAGMVGAQQIYTNGPISTGATTVLAGGGGVAAPSGYTWSEMNASNTTIGFSISSASPARMADDFTVNAGDVWTVTSIEVYAYQTGYTGSVSPITGGTLQIWRGNPSSGGAVVAGDTTTNVLTSSVQEFVYRIASTATGTTREVWRSRLTLATPAILPAGNYWIDVQLTASGPGTCFTPPVTITGTPSPAGANAQQFFGGTWVAATDGGGAQALAFLVNGTIGSTEIDVQRNSTSIPDGTTNHALGSVPTPSGQSFTFTILNTGTGQLDLTGTAPNYVVVTPGTGSPTVSVTTQPSTPIAASTGSTTFVVFVQPASTGAFDFTVSIACNEADEDPYNFTCTGTGFTNAPPVLALGTPTDFTTGSDFDLTVVPGASLAGTNGAVLRVTDPTPDPVNATITFTTGPQGTTPPAGITAPANVTAGAGSGFNLTWTGTANATNAPGTYVWNVQLTDGASTVNYSVRIFITNAPPDHVALSPTTGDGSLATPYLRSIVVGGTVAMNIATVSDANLGQNVSFVSQTLTSNPVGSSATFNFSVSPMAGNPVTLVCTPGTASTAADLGNFDYTIVVEDDTAPTPVQATIYVRITVLAGTAPAITSTAVTTATVGTLYTYTFTLTGNPTPTLSLTTGTLPAWLTLTGNTLSGTPPTGSAGTYGPFTFTASNGVLPDATQTFSIVVSNAGSGGGGGGGDGDDGGCSTGESHGLWLLAGVLASVALALRLRRKTA